MYEKLIATLRAVDEYNTSYAKLIWDAADAIEELSKQRDRAYDRLCGWCGVCPVDRRNVEDCEIAMIGPEYISPDLATCQPEPPKEGRAMNKEEKLEEMSELADHIIGALRSGTFIPMSYVRRYNDLVKDVFGGEDPELKEAEDVLRR